VSALDASLNPVNPDPFLSVVNLGGNHVAEFRTGLYTDGLFAATLSQSYFLDPAKPWLYFDLKLSTAVADPTGSGTSLFGDSLVVSVADATNTYELLLVDRAGAWADPFGTAPGTVALGVPPDSLFDFRLSVDLSTLAGNNVDLFFDLTNEDDGFQWTSPSFDNSYRDIKPLSPIIPEPASFIVWVVLGLTSAGFVRRRRRR
jgi:hypothetical protein